MVLILGGERFDLLLSFRIGSRMEEYPQILKARRIVAVEDGDLSHGPGDLGDFWIGK